MTVRKIELMHKIFGGSMAPEAKCKTCTNLVKQVGGSRTFYKCRCYSESNSEASDWRVSFPACGLYNRVYDGSPIISMVRREKAPETPINGQISLFDERGDTQ